MTNQPISRDPADVHAPVAAYAHQMEVGSGGRWLVLSGQIGMHPDGTLHHPALRQRPSQPGPARGDRRLGLFRQLTSCVAAGDELCYRGRYPPGMA